MNELDLSKLRSGRVYMHLKCMKRDHHYKWHGQGIVREVGQLGWFICMMGIVFVLIAAMMRG